MCCTIIVQVPDDEMQPFHDLVMEIWGEEDDDYSIHFSSSRFGLAWKNPPRKLTGMKVASVDMLGQDHDVEPVSWLHAVKYAVGLYEEALRRDLHPSLEQVGKPCPRRHVAAGESPVEIERFCHAGLEGIDGV